MRWLRSALFAVIFYTGTVPFVLLSFPISLLGTGPLRRWADTWCLFHRVCARWLLGIRSRIEGEMPRGAYLVAGKHQSMFETLEMFIILDSPAMVLKRE